MGKISVFLFFTLNLFSSFTHSSHLELYNLNIADKELLEQEEFNNDLAPNWFHLFDRSQTLGIESLDHEVIYPYPEGDDIIVAVIDSGLDINHSDLVDRVWINQEEIPDNGIDDDQNGYIDDIYGWNFLGENEYDSHEKVRKLKFLKSHDHQNPEIEKLQSFLSAKRSELLSNLEKLNTDFEIYKQSIEILEREDSTDREIFDIAVSNLSNKYGSLNDLERLIKMTEMNISIVYNPNFSTPQFQGNNKVDRGETLHGTHVAGIIAAIKSNNFGINGISSKVKIMPLKAIPQGTERDENVAKAIRYAVDNGAKIINLSFNKYFSENSKLVIEASLYAEKNNVLIVNSAGNQGINIDKTISYPQSYIDHPSRKFKNWIVVAASGSTLERLVPHFTNYGRKVVDLFAPGVQINSLAPNNKTIALSGTSMAAPIVSGAAAVLLSHNPNLTPKSIIEILKTSVRYYPNTRVRSYKHRRSRKKRFSSLSSSRGILNLKNAIEYLYRNYRF